MSPLVHDVTLVSTLVVTVVVGALRLRHFDMGTRILFFMVVVDMISEAIALYTALKYHTNAIAYNISGVLDFFLLSMYFNDVIDVFYKRKIGWYIAGGSIVLWIVNLMVFQPINVFGTNFLFVEGFVIIAVSLFGFFRLLLHHDQLRLYRYHHFWFIAMILLYWSLTFLNFGFYSLITIKVLKRAWVMISIIWLANVLLYLGIAIVFLLYPKMQKGDERTVWY